MRTCSFDTVTVHHRQEGLPRRENLNPTISPPARNSSHQSQSRFSTTPQPMDFHTTPAAIRLTRSPLPPIQLRSALANTADMYPRQYAAAPALPGSGMGFSVRLCVRHGSTRCDGAGGESRRIGRSGGCTCSETGRGRLLGEGLQDGDGSNSRWEHWALQRD